MDLVLVFSCLHLVFLSIQQVSGSIFNGFDHTTDGNATGSVFNGFDHTTDGNATGSSRSQMEDAFPFDDFDPFTLLPTSTWELVLFCSLIFLSVVFVFLLVERHRISGSSLEGQYPYKDLHKATNGFDRDNQVGKGGFGEVFKGILSRGQIIAVKRVSTHGLRGKKQFMAEVVTRGKLQHRSLVSLLGHCRRENEVLLVYEYMPNSSLDRFLFFDEHPPLSWLRRFSIIKDIGAALKYMHSEADKVVIHRDIKSANVMLDAQFNGKLGDFGLAKSHEHGGNTSPQAL